MTYTHNRLLDEIAKLATDAAGVAHSARVEVENVLRTQMEHFLNEMDMVPREEFEAIKDIAVTARNETEALRDELAALQKTVAALKRQPKTAKPTQQRKSTTRNSKKQTQA